MNRNFDEKLYQAVEELARKYNLAVEGLTERQLASAILQACACGDFQRLVQTPGGAQSVVYIPFAREQELLSRIRELEAALEVPFSLRGL